MNVPDISFWEAETYFAPQDYIIVGAGLLGLWSAYELKQSLPNAKITILERGVIPTGASTRNAGFACFGSPTEMLSDIERMGEEEMWKLVEMRYKGIQKIRKVLGDEIIEFDGSGGFECYVNGKHNIIELENHIEYLNKGMQSITGIDNTFVWSNHKITEKGLTGFDGMVENKLEGGLHSGKLVRALTKKVQDMGVNMLWGTKVENWINDQKGLTVNCTEFKSKTIKLIIATNAFNSFITNKLKTIPARGQILLTEPIHGLKLSGTFHFDEGFYYFRNVGNRILLGGGRNISFEDEETTSFETTELIQKSLKSFLNQYIIKSSEIKMEYKWSGIMAFSQDKKPCITEVEPNVFSVICCNGMGVALSPIIAEKLVEKF